MKKSTLFNYLLYLLFFCACIPVVGQTQINDKYCFDAGVLEMAKAPDGGMFVGGSFTNVSDYCGGAVKFNAGVTAGFNINDVKVNGVVFSIVPIPGGGWYLGGSFSYVNNIPRRNIVRINADGSLHSFNPSAFVDIVYSLAITSDGKLYVGNYVGIVSFNPDGSFGNFTASFTGPVKSLALDGSGILLVGGSFTSPRNRLAKFNTDGSLSDFNVVFDTGEVTAVKFDSTGGFLVGGNFTTVNGNSRKYFAKFNADATLNAFNPNLNGTANSSVKALAVDASDNFYIGGSFTTVNGAERYGIAKFNATGILAPFESFSNYQVNAITLDDTGVYCAGTFNSAVSSNNILKFHFNGNYSRTVTSTNKMVYTMAFNASGTLYAGGAFTGINNKSRKGLAKFNADGTLHTFAPNIALSIIPTTPSVRGMVVDGLGNLYICGYFSSVNSQARSGFAKFDATLTLTSFSPISNSAPFQYETFSVATDSNNSIYIGGNSYLKKYNVNGVMENSHYILGIIGTIEIDEDDNAYVGGAFVQIDGEERNFFAKINANGTLSGFNPGFNSTVYSLTINNTTGDVYAGGLFTLANGEPRTGLAKINADGSLNAFNPVLSGTVRSLETDEDGNLYVGGQFVIVNGIVRNRFAKFNLDGILSNFQQRGGTSVNAILLHGAYLYVGGGFQEYQVYTNIDNNCDLSLSNPQPTFRCGAGTVQLSIIPSSGTVNWYDAPTNGNIVGTGTTFTTPIISATTSYYAQAVDGECVSFERTEVVATINNCRMLNLKLFIESYFNGSTMNSVSMNQNGVGNTTNVELITAELRDATSHELVATSQAMLQTDGHVSFSYPAAPSGDFYVAVKGGNFIQTWSANPVTIGDTPVSYDFTTSADKAFGGNMAQMQPGVFALYSGDVNQDGFVDLGDYTQWEIDNNNFLVGDYATDLNGDGFVDLGDYAVWEISNNNFVFAVMP